MKITISEKRKIAKLWKKLWLVDFNYNFECDWLIELSDNNLAGELVENWSFFRPITIEKIGIFMIIIYIEYYWEGIHGFPLYFLFLTPEKYQT